MRKTLLAGLLALGVAAPASAVDPKIVNRAVDRGVAALRTLQVAKGSWPHEDVVGATSLAGLTLLECGAAADDKAVVSAARFVRKESIPCTHVYSLSTALLFLDRLGDPADVPLIESMAVRLLAGQLRDGGWRYTTPPIPAEEMRRLEALVRDRAPAPGGEPGPGSGKRPARALSPEIQRQLDQVARTGPPKAPVLSDNSNTQFAALALWTTRRHGLPVAKALERVETRFRSTQDPGGGWCYFDPSDRTAPRVTPSELVPSPAMTCAGVLGLALAYGADPGGEGDAKDRPRDIGADRDLARGLAALSLVVGHPVGDRPIAPLPQASGKSFYFLWSLARACVALDLKVLNKKDWYAWGAEILLANQKADGTWQGDYFAGGADTCFALLFLKRANLLRELTSSVQGKLKDPAEAILRKGGIGGEGLKLGPNPAGEAAKSASARLADELVKAPAAERAALLQKLQETKGVENTEALAFAIPRLEGEMQQKAREALTARLTRLKADSLMAYLADDVPEIRRAAALACAAKKVAPAVPRLIPLLRDRETAVARAAHAALKELSGQDLGADPAGWEAWWKKQSKE